MLTEKAKVVFGAPKTPKRRAFIKKLIEKDNKSLSIFFI